MKQVAQHTRTGDIRILSLPVPAIRPGFVLVRTICSVISAGTERASVTSRQSSLFDRARQNPEIVAKIVEQARQHGLIQTIRRVRGRLDSWTAMGYSAAGEVVAVGDGVDHVRPGDRVACAGAGYASHAEFIVVPKNLCVEIPGNVKSSDAAFTTIGAIALQGVRQAAPTLGESVVVIGLGLIGQITIQLLKANGCIVIGVDLDADAVKRAKRTGADAAFHRTNDDVKKCVLQLTNGLGADAVLITAATKSDDPVRLAGDVCRDKGRVVLVGDVGLKLPRGPYYMKELDFRLSRSYGPGRYDPSYEEQGRDYPAGYVRWTERRNMEEFLRLLSRKRVDVGSLTTHKFSVDDAAKAYAMVTGKGRSAREGFVGVVLEYPQEVTHAHVRQSAPAEMSQGSVANAGAVGFIGAGSFAQASLLPTLQSAKGVTLHTACTANGLNASNVAKAFGFKHVTTDSHSVIASNEIGTVFVATRHGLHASAVIDALKAGKNVFVEKPLAMNDEELAAIVKEERKAFQSTGASVMVGFNRRFAPLVVSMKAFFENSTGPLVMTYRINAGSLPSTHWTRDPVEGGGRIVGEVCHFVDLMQYFANAAPVEVHAIPMGRVSKPAGDDDSVIATVRFADGSVGTITYAANGDSAVPKEYIEIFSTGRTAILDNYRRLTLYRGGSVTEKKRSAIDKGHHEEVQRYVQAVLQRTPIPIPFEESVAATKATFRMVDSLKIGKPVKVS